MIACWPYIAAGAGVSLLLLILCFAVIAMATDCLLEDPLGLDDLGRERVGK